VALLFVLIFGCAVLAEAWTFMMIAGMAHFHLLDAIHPISYGVSLQFVLITLPFQALAVLLSLAGDA
jgi:hypothetical protein